MEIDDILEEDLLEIFSDISVGKVTKIQNTSKKVEDTVSYESSLDIDNFKESHSKQPIRTSKSLEINSQNVDQFAILLKELLNNKTIEISIKIKES